MFVAHRRAHYFVPSALTSLIINHLPVLTAQQEVDTFVFTLN